MTIFFFCLVFLSVVLVFETCSLFVLSYFFLFALCIVIEERSNEKEEKRRKKKKKVSPPPLFLSLAIALVGRGWCGVFGREV